VLVPPDDDKSRDKHVAAAKGSAFGRGFDSRRLHQLSVVRLCACADLIHDLIHGRVVVAMPSLAFLPWMTIEEEATIGRYRFFPVELRGSDATPLPADVQRILAAHTDAFGHPLSSATLVQHVGRDLTADVEGAEVEAIFRAAEAVAFAGLATRRFFTHGWPMPRTGVCFSRTRV